MVIAVMSCAQCTLDMRNSSLFVYLSVCSSSLCISISEMEVLEIEYSVEIKILV